MLGFNQERLTIYIVSVNYFIFSPSSFLSYLAFSLYEQLEKGVDLEC